MLKFLKNTKRFVVFLIIFIFILMILSVGWFSEKGEMKYGVTFSPKQAEALGFSPQEALEMIFSDLGVKHIRLAAYWDLVEVENNEYDWSEIDWQVEMAKQYDADVILAIGGRLPRWPECHFPDWYGDLSEEQKTQEILEYIKIGVERYQKYDSISAWQVENEPFLPHFGECPDLNKELFEEEIALVRSLDHRPIVLTDSGELSVWVPAAKRADIFGTTMYRDTYSEKLKSYVHYPIEPGFFRFKKNLARLFASPKKWIVIELQAEPWGPKPFQDLSQEERDRTMNLEKFREIIKFSRDAGFREFYLWGVEWWLWEKEFNGNDELWEEARALFNASTKSQTPNSK